MTPADIAALRSYVPLVRRARAAGWYVLSFGDTMTDGRTWRRDGERVNAGCYVDQVDVYQGLLTIDPHDSDEWQAPVESVAQVTAVLELAGALPDRHVIDIRRDGWTIQHPLSCRPNLFACPVNRSAEASCIALTHVGPGQFYCGIDEFSGELAIGERIGGAS